MKKLIIILLTILSVGAFWLLSCSKGTPPDPCGPFNNRFSSTGLTINTLKIHSYDSSYPIYYFDTLKNTDSVVFSKLAIQLIPKKIFYIAKTPDQGFSFSLFNSAMACSPPVPYSDELNDYIIITSTKDFDQTHKSGSNLKDLFDVAILDRFKYIYYYRMSLKDYLALRPNTKDELILFLKKGPEANGEFSFKIEYCRTLGADQKLFIVNTLSVFIEN